MIRDQVLEVIKKHRRFLVTSHINPEGDSIGSQLALRYLLQSMGKDVYVINSDDVPKNLHFLPQWEAVKSKIDPELRALRYDAAIVVDCPSLERTGKVKELIKTEYVINIDHHVSNEHFGSLNWVDYHASAAGEMVYGLLKSSRAAVDDACALYLYVAIMTDTGSFRFSNTTAATHRIVSELLNHNIAPAQIYEHIYATKSLKNMHLLGEVLSRLKTAKNGKIIWCSVSRSMLEKYRLTDEATDDFIDFVKMTRGAEVIAFLRELEGKAAVKISLRSKNELDVNKVAQSFGGGGHCLASGCVIEGTLANAEKLIVRRLEKSIKKPAGS